MKKRKAVLPDELYDATSSTSLNSNNMDFDGSYDWEPELSSFSPQLLYSPRESDSDSNSINNINNDNNNDIQTEQEEEMDIRNSTDNTQQV